MEMDAPDEDQEFLYPPLATITPTDQRGVAWVIGVITLSHVLLTLALRLSVRWRRFQPDDFTLIAACFLVLCQTSVAFGAVGMGLGWSEVAIHGDSPTSTTWQVSEHLEKSLALEQLTQTCLAISRQRGHFHCSIVLCQDSCTPNSGELVG